MKTLVYILGLIFISVYARISTCNTPVSNDKELTQVTPDDSIKLLKKEILYTISRAENKVNANDLEIKKVDTMLAKQLKAQPVIKPTPVQKVELKKKGGWFYNLFR